MKRNASCVGVITNCLVAQDTFQKNVVATKRSINPIYCFLLAPDLS